MLPMKSLPLRFPLAVLLAFCSSVSLCAQEDATAPELSAEEKAKKVQQTVALARSYLGGEKKLESIETVQLNGVLVYGNGESGTIELVFKKPNYHQVISVIGTDKETSTLNRTEAWRTLENLQSPGAFQLSFYEVDDVRHLEATVVDMLSFLDVPPTRKGSIEYVGTQEIEGKEAIALRYEHSDRIWFRRYFDPETGRVMHMVNNNGVIFSYQGAIEANGVTFPEKTIVSFLTQFGEQRMEISYSSISVNEDVDLERFRVPNSPN